MYTNSKYKEPIENSKTKSIQEFEDTQDVVCTEVNSLKDSVQTCPGHGP